MPANAEITGKDKMLALKVIATHPELNGKAKGVGALLVDHFSKKTHRCDPGLSRLSKLVGCDERTVRRALKSLHKLGLIHWRRHGGRHLTNAYILDWASIRFLASRLDNRVSNWWCIGEVDNSVSETRTTQSKSADKNVHQTLEGNLEREPLGTIAVPANASSVEQKRPSIFEKLKPRTLPNSAEAALTKATKRWNDDLTATYKSHPDIFGQVIDFISPRDEEDATTAEMQGRGDGLRLLQDRFFAKSVAYRSAETPNEARVATRIRVVGP